MHENETSIAGISVCFIFFKDLYVLQCVKSFDNGNILRHSRHGGQGKITLHNRKIALSQTHLRKPCITSYIVLHNHVAQIPSDSRTQH